MNVDASARPFSGTMDVDEFMAFLDTRPHGEHWELIEGVAAGKFDVAVAALTVTAAREEILDFSAPFYTTGLGIAVASGGLAERRDFVAGVAHRAQAGRCQFRSQFCVAVTPAFSRFQGGAGARGRQV